MAKYEYLILDEDDTLLNFEKCELNAFLRTMEACKIVPEERLQKLFIEICDEVWLKYDLDNTNNADILKNYHKYYRSNAVERFVHLEEKIKTGMPPEQLSALYFQKYKEEFWPEDGAIAVCRTLSKYCQLVLATNGLAEIQRSRISPFMNYITHVFISEEVGAIKPSSAFYSCILNTLHVNNPAVCLMVGNSISTDIIGANEAGMDTCWYNRSRKAYNHSIKPAYEISFLPDLIQLIK